MTSIRSRCQVEYSVSTVMRSEDMGRPNFIFIMTDGTCEFDFVLAPEASR